MLVGVRLLLVARGRLFARVCLLAFGCFFVVGNGRHKVAGIVVNHFNSDAMRLEIIRYAVESRVIRGHALRRDLGDGVPIDPSVLVRYLAECRRMVRRRCDNVDDCVFLVSGHRREVLGTLDLAGVQLEAELVRVAPRTPVQVLRHPDGGGGVFDAVRVREVGRRLVALVCVRHHGAQPRGVGIVGHLDDDLVLPRVVLYPVFHRVLGGDAFGDDLGHHVLVFANRIEFDLVEGGGLRRLSDLDRIRDLGLFSHG